MKVFISYDTFTTAMEFSEGENSGILSVHILNGLRRENFLGHFSYGGQEFLKEGAYVQAPGAGIVLQPTTIGVELFLWAHGKSDLDIRAIYLTQPATTCSMRPHERGLPTHATGVRGTFFQ